MSKPWSPILLPTLCILAACGGASSTPEAPIDRAAAPAVGSKPTGKVIEVKAIADDKGNYFSPNKIEAHPGDVLRFTLVSGVHNVDFPADKNPGASGLPAASDMLQLPGQSLDIPVTLEPGHYHFQCDPHAALGMTGELEVEK